MVGGRCYCIRPQVCKATGRSGLVGYDKGGWDRLDSALRPRGQYGVLCVTTTVLGSLRWMRY